MQRQFMSWLMALALTGITQAATLEMPAPNTTQSGIGVITGWVCDAGELTVEFDEGVPIPLVYGSQRTDTVPVCGDDDNGFVAIWNWSKLNDGLHTAVVYDDGLEVARATFLVVTPGVEFLRGVWSEPQTIQLSNGQKAQVEWSEARQGFVATDYSFPPGTEGCAAKEARTDLLTSCDRVISDGSIDEEILTEVEAHMALSRAYAREHLGIDPPGSKVFIGTDPEWMTDRYLEAFQLGEGYRPGKRQSFSQCEPLGEAGLYTIFIPVCNDLWKDSSEVAERNLVAHEWWHTNVQYYLLNAYCCADNDRMQLVGPEWLFEGSAEVWVLLVTNDFVIDSEQEKAWRRERVPADFNLLDLNTRRGWREASDKHKHEARDLAAYMLAETAGLTSFVDFYGQLGDYYASEAAKVGLDSTDSYGFNHRLREFGITFFDSPERLEKLDEIFQAAFGRTMEEFAKEFRDSLR